MVVALLAWLRIGFPIGCEFGLGGFIVWFMFALFVLVWHGRLCCLLVRFVIAVCLWFIIAVGCGLIWLFAVLCGLVLTITLLGC